VFLPPPPPFCNVVFSDWAPEMLLPKRPDGHRQPYSFTVDWWSFGCLLYEFVYAVWW